MQDAHVECFGNGTASPPSSMTFREVSSGTDYNCAIDTGGLVWCWTWSDPSPKQMLDTAGTPLKAKGP